MRTSDVALKVNPLYMKINKEQKKNGDQGCGIIAVRFMIVLF